MSGAVAYVLQWARIQSQAYAQLSRDASDFRELAYLNIDPGTGKPFTDVSDLLRGALQSKTLSESGGILGISDGKVVWKANSSVTVRPENDPAFVALVLDKSKLSNVTTERYTSGSTDYAYLVVPVSWIYTGETGALVRVIDLSIERKALNETFVTYSLVGVGAIAVTAVITWLVMARLLQPISWLQRTAEEITEHDLKRRIPVRGNDDLAALTTTVNGMLDRLESTVEAQKSLLDDVGHELRTPMTIVRGHLELMDTTDPKDAEVVRALALEELARMSSLVNDLILLAQSERSDCARRMRSLTSELMRASSSRARARTTSASFGSVVSMSSRWPRTIVIGVRSSCPTSSRRLFCASTVDSSRSSIPFTVVVNAARSSLPRTGMRRLRSCSVISSAVRCNQLIGCSNRAITSHVMTAVTAIAPTPTSEYVTKVSLRALRSMERSMTRTSAPVSPV